MMWAASPLALPCGNNGLVDRSKGSLGDRSKAAGSDFLQLRIGAAPRGGRSGWLAGQLRLAIADGRLPVGATLPASRVLASELNVSRGVVTEAYRRLGEDGHVAGRGRAGTIVVAAPVVARPAPAPANLLPAALAGSAWPPGAGEPAPPPPSELFATAPGTGIFDAMRAMPARIDLSPGLPDLAAFPRSAWLRAERAVLDGLSPADLAYGDPRGVPALRGAVAGWLARTRGIRADPGDVIIVAGVSQALGLLSQALRADGITAVAVEEPGSLGVRQHLQGWRLATPPAAVDAGGLRVDELRASGAAAVLVTPAHQFPTGVVLSGRRRQELLDWARAGGLVIEDDYDAEHRYDRPPVPALRALLGEQACYAGSVSKLLAPALRLGWVLPPPRYRAAVIVAKRNADLGNAALPQLVLARLIETGELERQLRFVRRRHRRRRDVMIEGIRAHLPGAQIHGAAAGLHLMITFPGDFADTDLAAAAADRGVKVHPLSWHHQRAAPAGLVLGYAASTPADIADAVATLGEVLGELPGSTASPRVRARQRPAAAP
jgi:GntR family transcriptional regulator / MocR family aminotransferase